MIYGCSQPRELWFIDFNHVQSCIHHTTGFLKHSCIPAGSVPCLEGMMRNLSRRAKAESEFNALVDMVSDAVREARKHHTRDGVKVCAHTWHVQFTQSVHTGHWATMHLICPLVLCSPPMHVVPCLLYSLCLLS